MKRILPTANRNDLDPVPGGRAAHPCGGCTRAKAWAIGLALAIVAGVPLWPDDVKAAECQASRPVELTTKRIREEISTDTTVSVAEVLRLAGPVRAARHFPLLGMSKSTLSYALATTIDTFPAGNGLVCATPKSVQLTIGYVARTVFVVREAADDRCLFRANAQHQLAHAHSDDRALDEFLPTLSRRLKSAIDRISLPPSPDDTLTRAALNAEVAKRLEAVLQLYDERHDAVQRAVDSPDELARLRDACAGRGGSIVEKTSPN